METNPHLLLTFHREPRVRRIAKDGNDWIEPGWSVRRVVEGPGTEWVYITKELYAHKDDVELAKKKYADDIARNNKRMADIADEVQRKPGQHGLKGRNKSTEQRKVQSERQKDMWGKYRLVARYYGISAFQGQIKYNTLKMTDAKELEMVLEAAANGECHPDVQSCPQCASPMVERDGPRGPFLGCSKYPACRGLRQISFNVAQAIPTDEQRQDAQRNISKAMQFIVDMGGVNKARHWIGIASQAMEASS